MTQSVNNNFIREPESGRKQNLPEIEIDPIIKKTQAVVARTKGINYREFARVHKLRVLTRDQTTLQTPQTPQAPQIPQVPKPKTFLQNLAHICGCGSTPEITPLS